MFSGAGKFIPLKQLYQALVPFEHSLKELKLDISQVQRYADTAKDRLPSLSSFLALRSLLIHSDSLNLPIRISPPGCRYIWNV
jgi:hypothetical protein